MYISDMCSIISTTYSKNFCFFIISPTLMLSCIVLFIIEFYYFLNLYECNHILWILFWFMFLFLGHDQWCSGITLVLSSAIITAGLAGTYGMSGIQLHEAVTHCTVSLGLLWIILCLVFLHLYNSVQDWLLIHLYLHDSLFSAELLFSEQLNNSGHFRNFQLRNWSP